MDIVSHIAYEKAEFVNLPEAQFDAEFFFASPLLTLRFKILLLWAAEKTLNRKVRKQNPQRSQRKSQEIQ